jgi:queuine tRNA-ribosyltransferase subunit QTRTD1
MNFVIEHLGRAGERAGNLELKSKIFSTPFPLLSTKGGSVPHLTRETLAYLNLPETAVLIPYSNHVKQTDILQQFKKGLGRFVGLDESLVVVTIQDPGDETRTGYNGAKNISVWNNCNRELVTPGRLMEFLGSAKPDIWVPLCDGDTPEGSSNKRISKSVKKSLEYLDTCLELKNDYPELKNSFVLAAVEGGTDMSARKFSATQTKTRPVHGFLMDGFHNNGDKAESISWDVIKESFIETINILPKEKPRFYFGPAKPDLVFNLLSSGVDVFDSSYPNLVTERDRALIFPNQFKKDFIPEKRISGSSILDVCMKGEEMRLDMSPLVSGCTCYTCRNFTRAYINHLILVKEMLAKVLLNLHNLHHYQTFFKSLRSAVVADQVDNFKLSVLQ